MPAASLPSIHPVLGHFADLARNAPEDVSSLLAVCVVLAGFRSYTAIAEWAADADAETLAGLGVTRAVPSESTFRRTLQRLDADAFDDLAGQWAAEHTAPRPGGRRVIAVDGKTLRGSGHGSQASRHLLAAFDHAHGAVLGQVGVDTKTNEIPIFSTLLDRLDVTGAVITADALQPSVSTPPTWPGAAPTIC
jgi:DDE family transposase